MLHNYKKLNTRSSPWFISSRWGTWRAPLLEAGEALLRSWVQFSPEREDPEPQLRSPSMHCASPLLGFCLTFSIPSRSHLNSPQLLEMTAAQFSLQRQFRVSVKRRKRRVSGVTCSVCVAVCPERWPSVHRDIWRSAWRRRATAARGSPSRSDPPAWSRCSCTGDVGAGRWGKNQTPERQTETFQQQRHGVPFCRWQPDTSSLWLPSSSPPSAPSSPERWSSALAAGTLTAGSGSRKQPRLSGSVLKAKH